MTEVAGVVRPAARLADSTLRPVRASAENGYETQARGPTRLLARLEETKLAGMSSKRYPKQ